MCYCYPVNDWMINGETLHTFSNVLHILIMSLNFKIMVLKIIICIVSVILYCKLKFFEWCLFLPLNDVFVCLLSPHRKDSDFFPTIWQWGEMENRIKTVLCAGAWGEGCGIYVCIKSVCVCSILGRQMY